MTIESTRALRAWRLFWVSAAVMVVAVACSGSSGGHPTGAGATTTTRRPAPPPTSRTTPRTTPHTTTTVKGSVGPPSRVVQVPTSVDATGKADDTKALQQFIAKVPNGSVVEFRHNGRYRVEGTLFVRNRRNLTFDGEGSLMFVTTRGAPDRAQWWIKDGSNIVFRNIAVRGDNPNGGVAKSAYVAKLATQHGFRFEGVNGAQLDNVQVTDVYGDFVYVSRDKQKVPSRNVWIHNSTFRRNGRQGIAVVAATNVVIEHNLFDDTRRSTIDLEPNGRSWRVSNVFVLDNIVGKGRLLFVASHGQGPVNDVVISGNTLKGHALTIDALAPGKTRRSNWVITDNVSNTTVHSRPMRLAGIDGLVVSGNTQKVSGKQPGLVLNSDCGAHVSSNKFGAGGVRENGAQCRAALAIPRAAAILGRSGVVTPTKPTTPGANLNPPSPPRQTRPTLPRAPVAPGPAKKSDAAGWVAFAAGLALLLAIAVMWVRSRRRSGGGADD